MLTLSIETKSLVRIRGKLFKRIFKGLILALRAVIKGLSTKQAEAPGQAFGLSD